MKTFTKAAIFLALVAGGQLYAQPTGTPPAVPAKEAAPAAKVAVKLTGPEMVERSKVLEAQIKVDIQHVQHLQATARREKDVIKLSCVNDKYLKLKAEANLFDTAHVELAANLDDNDRVTTAYGNVTLRADSVAKIRQEADACIGEPELGAKSENDFTHPDIPDDPTHGGAPFEDAAFVDPPVYASPFT